MQRVLYLALAFLAWIPQRASGHHAFAAEFSANNPITLSGSVVKLVWLNPHARFLLDVTDGKGAHTQWEMVLGSPNVLIRLGWERTFLKAGDVVTVTGFQARDGSHLAAARTIQLPGGRIAHFGAAVDGGPGR